MSKFIINGGKQLTGEIRVSGSKNAVLPIIAATLLTDEECVLTNVPRIKDVATMVDILHGLGVEVKVGDHKLAVSAKKIKNEVVNAEKVGKLRGSILLVGALLGRSHKAVLPLPGGDKIGVRPIETHINAFKALGVQVSFGELLEFEAKQLIGAQIILEESSVTATENAMMAAVKASGETVIKLAAMEPHVQQLAEFLNQMGAKITGAGTTILKISGVEKLHGANVAIQPDAAEAASFITLAAVTKGDVKITQLDPNHLDDFLLKMKKMNVNFEVGRDFVWVKPPKGDYLATKIQCGLYPKLNSDYMPPLAVLATQAVGETFIEEWMYENRLGHIPELVRMGADAQILDPHRVKIVGPTSLKGAKMTSYDLRMGMTMVIAALTATGESEIDGIEHIDRGYENLEQRLSQLGADIKRTE
jgi:UDP-N-acetylglucosamine 1-carboxyvinyltransferase